VGPIVCSETSVRNYHYTLRNDPEERRSLPPTPLPSVATSDQPYGTAGRKFSIRIDGIHGYNIPA